MCTLSLYTSGCFQYVALLCIFLFSLLFHPLSCLWACTFFYTRTVAFTKWSPAAKIDGPHVEAQFATNYLGHFALCLGLLPELIKAGTPMTGFGRHGGGTKGRIVLVSSVLHKVCMSMSMHEGFFALPKNESKQNTPWLLSWSPCGRHKRG